MHLRLAFVCLLLIPNVGMAQGFSVGPELGLSWSGFKFEDWQAGEQSFRLKTQKHKFSPQFGAFIGFIGAKWSATGHPYYGKSKATLDNPSDSNNPYPDLEVESLNLPIILGYKVIGPLWLHLGLNLKYVLSTSTFNPNTRIWNSVREHHWDGEMDLQTGLGISFGNLLFRISYQNHLGLDDIQIPLQNQQFEISTRRSNLIMSLAINLKSGKKSAPTAAQAPPTKN